MKHLSIGQLEGYALRELSSREQQRVENHVTRCSECLDGLYHQVAWVKGMRQMNRLTRKFSQNLKESPLQKRMNGPR
jgi:Putative zinc-finger